jgi:hypothetical protein
MTKVIIAVAVGLIAAYAYAQGVGPTGPSGRFQISASQGQTAWKIDTATGNVWHCSQAHPAQCVYVQTDRK